MEGKCDISDYRSKLDNVLASRELTNYETIRTLVKNQILQSSDSESEEYSNYVVEKRSKEMFNFLSMLRSASASDVDRSKSSEESHSGWKVKQDSDEYRVMYREGPEGTPLHTLLVEGYVDGPLDVCLCVSFESDLYKRWWPQTAIPTFKVISSHCVKKVRIGEHISLVRMKVSWPLASREALVHFFALEYFKDGLIVVLLNSISDLENIDKSTHGFTRDGIPDAEDVVRIDVVGGLVLQKVTADRSYFRTIANVDIKLDFVPPASINFISRQLVGSGFKLYKKEIASVSKGDGKFREALSDPMYTRIRVALYTRKSPPPTPPLENWKNEQNTETRGNNNLIFYSEAKNAFTEGEVRDEITEFEEREEDFRKSFDYIITDEIIEEVTTDETEHVSLTTNDITERFVPEIKDKVGIISPEVQRALGTLEKAISILRGYNSNSRKEQSDENGQESLCVGSLEMGSAIAASHELKNDFDNHGSRHKGSYSDTRETNRSKIAPADEVPTSVSYCSVKQITVSTFFDKMAGKHLRKSDANITKGKKATTMNDKKSRFCCFASRREQQG